MRSGFIRRMWLRATKRRAENLVPDSQDGRYVREKNTACSGVKHRKKLQGSAGA